jgi:hypothetical protein
MFSLDDLFFVGVALDFAAPRSWRWGSSRRRRRSANWVDRPSADCPKEPWRSASKVALTLRVGHDRLVDALVMGGVAIGVVLILRQLIRPWRIAHLRDRVDRA